MGFQHGTDNGGQRMGILSLKNQKSIPRIAGSPLICDGCAERSNRPVADARDFSTPGEDLRGRFRQTLNGFSRREKLRVDRQRIEVQFSSVLPAIHPTIRFSQVE